MSKLYCSPISKVTASRKFPQARSVCVAASPVQKNDISEPRTAADGSVTNVMIGDYGFRSGAGRLYTDEYGEVPADIFSLATANFKEEWLNMRRSFIQDQFSNISVDSDANLLIKAGRWLGSKGVRALQAADKALVDSNILQPIGNFPSNELKDAASIKVQQQLAQLTLDSHAVEAREKKRFIDEPPNAPWVIKLPYFALCIVLDIVYEGRPIQRFWVLEEVARMPYFAFISMLHLYESFGWWRAGAALRKVHFAEEWNELHHLQIMESLGGDQLWLDRFIAQHSAIVYYWFLIAFYAFSPKSAYQFSDLVEGHATDTYAEFVIQNEALLKELPPPSVAVEYYTGEDVYMFETFMTTKQQVDNPRQPKCETLYDVFINIRDDEIEHKATMVACQDPKKIASDIAASGRLTRTNCQLDYD